ncbi:MAG: bifunctional aldolase/short-chain dehydrogenase, partial [Rhodospirillales bacterium]|nr:bifunctional aldolase/short-chain dehydrogenase [Rhodospirillales bacterium]
YARLGIKRDLALRVYTTRLLGSAPALVLHGGGNTSLKTVMADARGETTEVLRVKGSGRDMASAEPAGLPALRLEPLRRLIDLDRLDGTDMVEALRAACVDGGAPNPSVETLLHAFLPHRFIDHTHANAILALTNQPKGAKICAAVFGRRVGIVPYLRSGFDLARKAHAVYAANPDVEGLILLKHGIVTFGDDAKTAYGRMIDLVSLAEARLAKGRKRVFAAARLPRRIAPVAAVAPIVRGLTAIAEDVHERRFSRPILAFRSGRRIRAFVDGAKVKHYARRGPATPDHAIRVKPWPLVVASPVAGKLDVFTDAAQAAVADYQAAYRAYFARHARRHAGPLAEIDPMPRVVLVPGLGLFGLGATASDAAIAADLACATIDVVTGAEAIGRYQSINEAELFDIEYWSLEQAKLGGKAKGRLAGQVTVVTGGASGIGAATARVFSGEGAQVAVLDRDHAGARAVAADIGGLALACDVTDKAAVARAFARVAETYGGLDIVVSNAGAAWQGRIGEVDDDVLRHSFELNFWAHQSVAQNAVSIMRAQGLGGCLLFNTSKQAVNPGPDFGPYGVAKAATLFLMRQYAVDHGAEGIRSNAVNADRIRSGLLTEKMIGARSKARGLSRRGYMSGNLLGVEVTAADVAQAFVDLALATKTTAAVMTVDGGNIAAALR